MLRNKPSKIVFRTNKENIKFRCFGWTASYFSRQDFSSWKQRLQWLVSCSADLVNSVVWVVAGTGTGEGSAPKWDISVTVLCFLLCLQSNVSIKRLPSCHHLRPCTFILHVWKEIIPKFVIIHFVEFIDITGQIVRLLHGICILVPNILLGMDYFFKRIFKYS